ncbi:MAG: hypothetical protein QOH25_3820 [Acidobacteriota bacterium]|jgi:GNAT superfamily N-acetyltransferase|nr:hypothetical protein [Acidobacteriota bacterium]
MQNDIQVKQFDLSEKDVLLNFLRVAYPDEPRKSDPTYWAWHFLQVPSSSPDNIPLWIAKVKEEIVGQLAAIPVEIKVGDEVRRAMWILDFVVHPRYRRKGLGKRLVRATMESCPVGLGINTDEQHAPALLESLGWVKLGNLRRYHKLLFPGNALREIAQRRTARRIVNFGYAPFRPRLSQISISEAGTLRRVKEFDASFDALWQRTGKQWPCAVVRSAQYLEWQFARQPGKQFDVLGFYENDALVGYVVLFFRKAVEGGEPSKAAISDLCYDADGSTDVIDELLKAALSLAIERRAGGLVTDVNDPKVEERLRHFGFWRIKKAPQFMVKAPEDEDLIFQMGNWFLTRGDSDISLFEESNL